MSQPIASTGAKGTWKDWGKMLCCFQEAPESHSHQP